MINSKKMKQRMKELGIKQSDMAKILGLAQSTVNQKINNVRPMTVQEAEIFANCLSIPDNEFSSYFFAQGVA